MSQNLIAECFCSAASPSATTSTSPSRRPTDPSGSISRGSISSGSTASKTGTFDATEEVAEVERGDAGAAAVAEAEVATEDRDSFEN